MKNDQRHQVRVSEFSEFPGGRHPTDGPNSGEQFREQILKPAFKCFDCVEIDFTGVFLVAPSFIDEALGPFMEAWGEEEFDRRVKFLSEDDPDLLEDLKVIRGNRFRR